MAGDTKHILRFHFDTGAVIEGEYEHGTIEKTEEGALASFSIPDDAVNAVLNWKHDRVLAVTVHQVDNESQLYWSEKRNKRLAEALLALSTHARPLVSGIDQPEFRALKDALDRANDELSEYYD